MENVKEKVELPKKINGIDIKNINPNDYKEFCKSMKENAENNEILKKNLAYLEKILDLMKTMDQHSEEKDVICLVCEFLLKGSDINEAIEKAESIRLKEYLKLAGKAAFKLPEEQKSINTDRYRVMVNNDRENVRKIKEIVSKLDEEKKKEPEELTITEEPTMPQEISFETQSNVEQPKHKGRNSFIDQLRELAKKGDSRKSFKLDFGKLKGIGNKENRNNLTSGKTRPAIR